MGMFDDIRVEFPVEGFEPFDAQTKSLECALLRYRIDLAGKLWLAADTDAVADPSAERFQATVTGEITVRLPDDRVAHFWTVDGSVRDVAIR